MYLLFLKGYAIMKNLFDYATKELSQDAFLRWLFENFDCEDDDSLKAASRYVLKKLCKLSDDEEINEVNTYSQWHKIDVFAFIKTNKRNIALFVEDKVFSAEHNQLTKYNEIIDNSLTIQGWELNKLKCMPENVVKVFYKSSYIFDNEREAVEKAGWKTIDISDISKSFNSFYDTDCIILKQYIEHIKKIEKAWKTHEMPASSEKGLDLIKWQAYFEFEVKPRLGLDGNKYVCKTFITNYNYTCLYIGRKCDENVPYIELRSRDISKDGFFVRILCHGVDYDRYSDKIKQVEIRLKNAPNKAFTGNFTHRHQAKLLGKTERISENLLDYLKKCIEDYDYAMRDW